MTRRFLALKMAWRYLTSPKSHGAVSVISFVSIVGVAVASAAIIIVLSVFNGFRVHLGTRLDSLTADISVSPAFGKVFENVDSLAEVISSIENVEISMPSLTDNALVIANSREMPVTLKGVVPATYAKLTSIDSLLLDGTPIEKYNTGDASISVGVAQRLGIYSSEEPILIFAPRRLGRINPANPASSFISDSLNVASVFRSMQEEFDDNTVICDINTARELFQYDAEASSVEIKAVTGSNISVLADKISEVLGPDYIVKDRFRQQEMSFRMVAIEKWITFLLLAFILLIASFNIISTVCMLIVEKQNSLTTLSDMGMSRNRIGNIFWWESIFVTLIGTIAGMVTGVVLSLLQEYFGFIKLAGDPESLVMLAYPVSVEWKDLLVTLLPITLIGLATAFISRGFAMSKIRLIA